MFSNNGGLLARVSGGAVKAWLAEFTSLSLFDGWMLINLLETNCVCQAQNDFGVFPIFIVSDSNGFSYLVMS